MVVFYDPHLHLKNFQLSNFIITYEELANPGYIIQHPSPFKIWLICWLQLAVFPMAQSPQWPSPRTSARPHKARRCWLEDPRDKDVVRPGRAMARSAQPAQPAQPQRAPRRRQPWAKRNMLQAAGEESW